MYRIDCPWRGEHTGKDKDRDAAIYSDKPLRFNCFHAHCQANHRGFKDLIIWGEIQKALTHVNREHKSLTYYYHRTINKEACLLGNRWLCRGGGAIIAAASGIGKSVLTAQAVACFANGLPALDIKPYKPLRSLILQSEDDDDELTEHAKVMDALHFGPKEMAMVDRNTNIISVPLCAEDFIRALPGLLKWWTPDLLWINPYTAFAPPIYEPGENIKFLRQGISPIIKEYDCGCIIMHHNPKPKSTSVKPTKTEASYMMSGYALLVDWARAIIIINQDKGMPEEIFSFTAAKRGKRIGWDLQERNFCQSDIPGQLLWSAAVEDPSISIAVNKDKYDVNDVVACMPATMCSHADWYRVVKEKIGMSQPTFDKYIKEAIRRKMVKNPGKKYVLTPVNKVT
jgi:hypothetical protein